MKTAARLPLLWKILLSTSVSITVLFAFAGWIILRHVSATTSQSIEQEVQASLQAYESLWQARARMLASLSLVMSNMADVRAAFSTGDEATIRDTAQELWSKVSEENAIFLVADPQGGVIASLGGDPSVRLRHLDLVTQARRQFPKQATGFLVEGESLYQIAVTPVYVHSSNGSALWNVLVTGFRVDFLAAHNLKQSTGGSEFLFRGHDRIFASTLPLGSASAFNRHTDTSGRSGRIRQGAIEYATLTTSLADVEGKPVAELWILRSFQSSQERFAALQRDIFFLWILAVCTGLAITYLLARRIVRPIRELASAADGVAHQDYTRQVPVESEDELGTLARAFNSMCDSIRIARDELIRQERIATIGRMSSSLVHDLRNPLAAIYGSAEMLVDRELPAPQVKRLADSIYRASRNIQRQLQELLEASRKQTPTEETCSLAEVVNAAREAVAATAEQHSVQISIDISESLEAPMHRSRMERVFLNLLNNAVEAMPSGGCVRISAHEKEGQAIIVTEDNGPGIRPEILENLFRPFVSYGKKNGLGLGLALSRQTVLDHGGDLGAENIVGGGARFQVRLPIRKI